MVRVQVALAKGAPGQLLALMSSVAAVVVVISKAVVAVAAALELVLR